MEADFWHQRWKNNEIGFHQKEINSHLQSFWPEIHVKPNGSVFVPLCGKSRDMLWLRGQGYHVIGVEISPLAVESFFAENDLQPEIRKFGSFEYWECDGLSILRGDFFDLQPADLAGVDAVFDRASLIALPPEMRRRYALHLHALLPESVEILLVTLQYPQDQMQGPPFAVESQEVDDLYAKYYRIDCLFSLDVLAENHKFRERGISHMDEKVFLLRNHQKLST
jgi:thiopurine S-methyltransferase